MNFKTIRKQTIIREMITIPFAKLILFLRMAKKKTGRLINELTLIRPPSFFFWKRKAIPFSNGPSYKNKTAKIVQLRLNKSPETIPFRICLFFKIPSV